MFWKLDPDETAVRGIEGEESAFGGKVKEVSTSIASGEEGACSSYIRTMINKSELMSVRYPSHTYHT
jgi:hypothetical protein